MRVAALLAVALLALAGCSGKSGPDPYTCKKTGQVIDLSKVAGSGKKGFDPESACPAPMPPSVAFTKLPASMTVYYPATAGWSVSPGNYTMGHSMLTQIRWSHHPIAVAQLTKPDDYGTMVAQFAHQDLPQVFSGKLSFTVAGTYYLRAYAQVRGEGLPDTDFWSPEVQLVVAPITANGTAITLTHDVGTGVGGTVGKFGPTQVSAKLGDTLVIVNKDVQALKVTFTGACKIADISVPAATAGGANGQSDPILMNVPGSCNVVSNDPAGQQQASVSVAQPL